MLVKKVFVLRLVAEEALVMLDAVSQVELGTEPLPSNSPLLEVDNIIVPHIGSASVATCTKMDPMVTGNLHAGLKGERPPYLVNSEVFV